MTNESKRAFCDHRGCDESSVAFNYIGDLLAWLLHNRWEVTWYHESINAEPTFRVLCPRFHESTE
jgi:hypothetical protein